MKLKRVLTIAGSDSGGGAGIQADLKTFAALGVHGMSAVTAITAQNTVEVTRVEDVSPELIEAQIHAVITDIGVDAIKTGMLHTAKIIRVVSRLLTQDNVPTVVDPVMIAKSGARLLEEPAIQVLITDLLPKATVVTPNAREAETLSGLPVTTLKEAKEVARVIAHLGPEAVVIKGGHLPGPEAIDVVYYKNDFTVLKTQRVPSTTTHGTGCSFASAIAAELAKGSPLLTAIDAAKHFIHMGIQHGLALGHGSGPVNPMAQLYQNVAKHHIYTHMINALNKLTASHMVARLIPESQSNLVMALPYATSPKDVIGIPGRIVKIGNRVHASSCPTFDVSSHVARTVLVAMQYDRKIRSAMNIRHSPEILDRCRAFGWSISSYDRREEPPEIKAIDGQTTSWGAHQAIKAVGHVPRLIYHEGDWGKEPMIILFGQTPDEVVQCAVHIADNL
ncbi:MAG: bifunctional hydroxymethylpyrimidine kinase/phosphomethylpyrimidine kinase [Candidatus Bathyarchaeota archaeon]|nr:bifunctional hydroxymethylpyrimidine kinase/phosphomethylpyrimidine kinase [Candidatus Bathyarchaeota archaeon]